MCRPLTWIIYRAGGGTRTHDLTITSRLRYQLRHTGLSSTLPPPCSGQGRRPGHVRRRRPEDACFGWAPLAGWDLHDL